VSVLQEILQGTDLERAIPDHLARVQVAGIAYDSRKVSPHFLFFAFPGAKTDGRKYAAEAVSRGAIAVISESPCPPGFTAPWLQTRHGRQTLALAARNFFHKPDERLCITGITGTNGKTTTAYLVESILAAAGITSSLIGTIEYHIAGEVRPAVNTTPESLDLLSMFEETRQRGGSHVTMEVSSHALALGRVYGILFHTAVFTNLTQDHLDFHGGMEEYFHAKRKLFEGAGAPPPKVAVLNADDPYSRRLGFSGETIWFGLGRSAALRAARISNTFDGLRFEAIWRRRRFRVESPLVGRFNVLNILAATGVGLSLGVSPETIAAGIAACRKVPGRFERVEEGQPFLVVVDYAHTEDALTNVMALARELKPKRVLTLFGCGGDRDRDKRPRMGMAAARYSDFVVLTSDNPRSEDPIAIINDVLVGLRRFDTPHVIEPNREAAIHRIMAGARPGDIVILAGKGHETYQIFKDRTVHFDDREVAREALRALGYGVGGAA